MDPVSLIASIAGITTAGIALSKSLYALYDGLESSQNEIADIASDLASFTVIVNELGAVFKSPKRVYSDALQQSLFDIIEKCRSLFLEIKRMIERAELGNKSKLSLGNHVKFVFRETKVRSITTRLETTKKTMSLMLLAIQMVADE